MGRTKQRSRSRPVIVFLVAAALLPYPVAFSVWRVFGPASRVWDVERSSEDLDGTIHTAYYLEVACRTGTDRALATAFYPALWCEAWQRGEPLLIWDVPSLPVDVPEWWR